MSLGNSLILLTLMEETFHFWSMDTRFFEQFLNIFGFLEMSISNSLILWTPMEDTFGPWTQEFLEAVPWTF